MVKNHIKKIVIDFMSGNGNLNQSIGEPNVEMTFN